MDYITGSISPFSCSFGCVILTCQPNIFSAAYADKHRRCIPTARACFGNSPPGWPSIADAITNLASAK